tara:strand:- start:893 stop:2836 length:1944 start_codon:yes stop_codon:yes gene_type:complete
MDRESLISTTTEQNICIVTFNSNVITSAFLDRLNDTLDTIENSDVSGVIFQSAKKKIFLAGADLYNLQQHLTDITYIKDIITYGQSTFNRIQDLNIPTVAAINGACLGGGLELALACTYRICSNDKSTKLGLPEVTLGFLPAWGGTTRLPKLIGLPTALKLILGGTQVPGKVAKKYGLVNNVVHKENLVQTSITTIQNNNVKKRKTSFVEMLPTSLILKKAKQNVVSKTKGNYPAPLKIIEVIRNGHSSSRRESLALELDAFVTLSQTDVCANLLRIFFLQEGAKKLKIDDTSHDTPISNMVVVGAGTMGAGIAQWISSRGVNVLLKDINDELICSGLQKIGDLYVNGVRGHKMDRPTARDGLAKITTTTEDVPLCNYQLVIEAIVEDLDVKRKVLSQLEEKLPDTAIIATNTSALSIDDMSSHLKHPERVVGIHFFNPVHKMKLVEVIRGTKTSDESVQRAVSFVHQIGKLPVVVKDSPGFVVNRILLPYLIDACRLYEDEFDPEVVDAAMVEWGMPMGPFRLMDEIGIDVCQHVVTDISERLQWHDIPDTLQKLIKEKKLGKKSGNGFYSYKKGKTVKRKVTSTSEHKKTIKVKLAVPLSAEAQRVVDEGIVDNPDDVDFAMIMGTGYAPFTGGPIKSKNNQNEY